MLWQKMKLHRSHLVLQENGSDLCNFRCPKLSEYVLVFLPQEIFSQGKYSRQSTEIELIPLFLKDNFKGLNVHLLYLIAQHSVSL